MQTLWNDEEARRFVQDPLQMRVYSSRLLGQAPDLVLHGGGNTSVKLKGSDAFGEAKDLLYVKGSGRDLKSVQREDFTPLELAKLHRIAAMAHLSDAELVRLQLAAMTDPLAPRPSIEAVLHALIPFRFVDHTHADAVLAITNTPSAAQLIQKIYGKRVLVVPYRHAGFVLAKTFQEMTGEVDWTEIEGLVLINHGVFTFGDQARQSYTRMITLVSEAEAYLAQQGYPGCVARAQSRPDLPALSRIRGLVSRFRGRAVLARLDQSPAACGFAGIENVGGIVQRGPLTSDHAIRIKPFPVVLGDDYAHDMTDFAEKYRAYFHLHQYGRQKMLDVAPRWAVWPGHGIIAFGPTSREVDIVSDIVRQTMGAIQASEALGGWRPLAQGELFAMEYSSFQQAKLADSHDPLPFAGQIALVTGAASGIGRACAEKLHAQGAAVVGVDINPDIHKQLQGPGLVGLCGDLTDGATLRKAVAETVQRFGGLDILVSNAGLFPSSCRIEDLEEAPWDHSMDVNLTSHQRLLTCCIPYLKNGLNASVIFIASKNVPAPGPGAAAYSVAKAGLTQLARVAALELGCDGIRVNVIHPNAVYDTALWTPELLASRACQYGCTIEEYKTNNCLKTEVTSADVAALVCALAGPGFAKTTGAQIPIDGGNERVI